MSKKKSQDKKQEIPSYSLVKMGRLIEEFQSEATKFVHIMSNDGGIQNAGMMDVLRRLQFVYLQIASTLEALRGFNKNIRLEDGVKALEYVRKLDAEKLAAKHKEQAN